MENEQQVTKAIELLRSFRTGMLITSDNMDELHMRPMMVAQIDEDHQISFVTSLESSKVEEVRRRHQVSLTFQSSGAFLALKGYATVVTDNKEKARVWKLGSELWFDGPEDPNAALIQVQPESIEYWDQRGLNAFRFAFEAVRAAASGTPLEVDERSHARVTL